jgi:hypothetical protein
MASTIIGNAIGATSTSKVLQRQNFNKEPNGLETIVESYAIATANRDTIVPEKDTLHSAFSSSAKKYTRMVVESVTTEEQDGGITQMLVTFVGLTTATGLPPAIVRIIPTPGAGIFGPNMVIEAEFLTDKSETDFSANGAGGLTQPPSFFQPGRTLMPDTINGTKMPANPREPFSRTTYAASFAYFGYIQQSLSCDRRGIFLIARATFAEGQSSVISIAGPFSGGGQ